MRTHPADPGTVALVERLLAAPLEGRSDLVGVHGARAGSGRFDGEFWQDARWFLKSRASRVYPGADLAGGALVQLIEVKRRLGDLTPARSTLALVARPDGALQLWTIAPRLETLRERLDRAFRARSWTAFGRALIGFAHGLGVALSFSCDEGLLLDASPANFAAQGARLRYIDDDVASGHDALGVEDALLARPAEYRGAPEAVWIAYLERFRDEVRQRLPAARAQALRLGARLRAAGQLRAGAGPWAERAIALLEDRS